MKVFIVIISVILFFINSSFISYAKEFDLNIINKMDVISENEISIVFNKSIANEPIDIEVYDVNQNNIPLNTVIVSDYKDLSRNKIVIDLWITKVNSVIVIFKSIRFMDWYIISQNLKSDIDFIKKNQQIEVPTEILDSIKSDSINSNKNLKELFDIKSKEIQDKANKNKVNNGSVVNNSNGNNNGDLWDNSENMTDHNSSFDNNSIDKNKQFTSDIEQDKLPKTWPNENVLIIFSILLTLVYFFKMQKWVMKS